MACGNKIQVSGKKSSILKVANKKSNYLSARKKI